MDSINWSSVGCKNVKISHDKCVKESKPDIDNSGVIDIPRDTEYCTRSKPLNKIKSYNNNVMYCRDESNYPYIMKDNLMTSAERTLFRLVDSSINSKLAAISKRVLLFPKVRIADFIDIKPEFNGNKKLLYKIAYKHVDYLVCDSITFNILCAIELDDFYHTKSDKVSRDSFVNDLMNKCKIPLFRVNTPIRDISESDISPVIDYLLDYYAPLCPKCGKLMVAKRSSRKANFGHRFYGCSGWRPDGSGCNFSLDID